jgi:predicted P-loop ATPase
MVSRVFRPGCQWDYVLVLEGAQGQLKSTIARTLASDAWFMDHLPDLRDKDAMLNLQGKWLVELGELADIKRSDYNLVKQYLARRVDTVRSPYGKIREDLPRQSVFIGTVNEGQYLRDPTGNRRYWPVKVGLCDVKGLRKVREQLFAEAYQCYLKGEDLYLKDAANQQAQVTQHERRVSDDSTEMYDRLLEFLHSDAGKALLAEPFRSRDLFEGPSAPWGSYKPQGWIMNVAAQALTTMGFVQHRKTSGVFWKMPEGMYLNGGGKLEKKPFDTKKILGSVAKKGFSKVLM